MTKDCRVFVSCRNAVRALTVAWGLLALCNASALAQEESLSPEASTPVDHASFQYATLTGTTNTINVTLLPVVNPQGVTTLKNVTLQFAVDSTGKLTLSSLQQGPAPTPPIAGFKAGEYIGPSTIASNMLITIGGPGLAAGGATEWTLSTPSGAWPYTYPASASWYDGPLTSNPIYKRISAAGITGSAWYYGTGGTDYSGDWEKNSLLGFSQVGNTLTIVSFTDSSGKDHNLPQDQVTYTLKQ